jgi:autotransporter-associated beta strand protein
MDKDCWAKGLRRCRSAMFVAASVGLTVGASGAAVNWAPLAGGSNAWETASNWAGGLGPDSTSDAQFNSSTAYLFQPQVNNADSVAGLVFGNTTGGGTTVTTTISANGSGGSLSIGSDGISMYSGSAAVTVSAPVTFAGTANVSDTSTSALTISGPITVGANTLNLSGTGPMTLSGVISGTNGLSMTGTSTLSIGGAQSFTGGVQLTSGGISISNPNGLGTNTVNVGNGVFNAAAVSSNNTPFFTAANNSAFTVVNNFVLPSPSSALVYTLQKNAATATTGTNLLLSGTITGGSSGMTLELNSNVGSDGSTSFELSGTNSIIGTVRVNRGCIILDNASSLGPTTLLQVQTNVNTTIGNVDLNGNFTLPNNVTLTTASDSFGVPAGDVATLSGVVTTATGFSKVGAGTLILTGANAITGSATVISTGMLQIGNGGTTGTLGTAAVTNNAALAFNMSGSYTYAGAITGTGSLLQAGSGTTILTGTGTYSGGINVSAGTLQIGSGGAAGSVTGNVINNSMLVFNQAGNETVSGNVSGSGMLTQAGSGILALTGNINLTGIANVSSGTLQLSGGATQAAGTINVSSGAAFTVNNSGVTATLNAKSLAFGTGNTTLNLAAGTGWNTTTPLFNLSGGLSTNGTTTVNLTSGTALSNATYELATFSGSIGGSGAFAVPTLPGHETGTLIQTPGMLSVAISGFGTNVWTGAANSTWDINTTSNWRLNGTADTYFDGDTVVFDDTAAPGSTNISLNGIVSPTSTTFSNNSSSYTISGTGGIAGPGGLTVQGTAPVTLLTNNTYTGGTTIKSGATLLVGNGSTGAIQGNIVNSGSLTLAPASNLTLGSISGNGTVLMNGPGSITLTGSSTFTSGLNLSGGSVVLSAAGALGTGPLTIGVGATNAASVSSTNPAFLTINTTGAYNISNNISLPSPATPTVYTLLKNATSTTSPANVLFTGALTGGNPNETLELNDSVSGDGETSFEFNASSPSLAGIIRLNRGSIIIDNATALGTSLLQVQTNGNPLTTTGNVVLNGSFTLPNNVTFTTTVSTFPTIFVGTGNTATMSGVFTTAIAWSKVGPGVLTFTGNNAISSPGNISTGTLQIGNGGTTGTLNNVNMTNSGVLAFNHSDNVTYSGIVSGTGTLNQLGAGVLSLTASNTYTGPTNVQKGTLQLFGGTTQTSPINVSGGATLAVSNSGATATLNDTSLAFGTGNTTLNLAVGTGWNTTTPLISLSGALTDAGTTTINLSSVQPLVPGSTYELATYNGSAPSASSIQLGALPGRGVATLSDTAGVLSLMVTSSDVTEWTGAVNGTWDINTTQNWRLVNANTPTTYMEKDDVQFDDNATGTTNINLPGTVNPGGIVFANNTSTYTISGTGSISGQGSVTIQGSGTTVFATNNNYSGGTTINSGTLQIGNGGSVGSITGNVVNNATLILNRSGTLLIDGAMSGSGNVVQSGVGTAIVSGNYALSGTTTINSGVLQVGNGGTAASMTGSVINNAALAFNVSNATAVSASISGTGSVTVVGAGGTALPVFSGSNTYSGGTYITKGGIAITNVNALGTGPIYVGLNANPATSYTSVQPNFLDTTAISGGTISNNIVLPAGNFAGTAYDPNSNDYYSIMQSGALAAGNQTTLSGLISGGSPNTIFYLNNNTGGNSQSLWSITNGNNSFVGVVRVNRGSLAVTSDGVLGPDTNPVYFFDNAGATLQFQYSGDFGHPIGDGQNNVILNTEGNSVNLTGVVFGTTGFIVQGLGTITLAGTNTVQGGFDVQGSTLNINNASALGTGPLQLDQFQGFFNSTIDNTSGAPITLVTNNAQVWTSDFTFTGTNSLNMGTGKVTMTNGSRTITVGGNTLAIGGAISDGGNGYGLSLNGPGTLVLGGTNSYTGGTQVNSGTIVFGVSGSLPANTSLSVSSGATAMIANHGNGSTAVLVASSLNNSGTIDITNNAMVIHNGSISSLYAEVAQGYNGGAWNGSSSGQGVILSSAAASDSTHLTAVGIGTGFTSFEGATVSLSDVLIKYTYYGDADLTGHVDSADYARIDAGYLSSGSLTGWSNGDFNYDGVINGSDYTLIDNAFNSQGVTLAATIAEPTAQLGGSAPTSAVPEPATIGILGIGVVALLGRRRRR